MKLLTNPTPENISQILEILERTPARLEVLCSPRSSIELNAPLAPDEWSFAEVMAHLTACAELTTHAIFYALLVDNPTLPNIHPQRNWAKLVRYEQFSFKSMLASFVFQRAVLLGRLKAQRENQWGRPVTREGKRQENIYRLARSLALHELDHLSQLEDILS